MDRVDHLDLDFEEEVELINKLCQFEVLATICLSKCLNIFDQLDRHLDGKFWSENELLVEPDDNGKTVFDSNKTLNAVHTMQFHVQGQRNIEFVEFLIVSVTKSKT